MTDIALDFFSVLISVLCFRLIYRSFTYTVLEKVLILYEFIWFTYQVLVLYILKAVLIFYLKLIYIIYIQRFTSTSSPTNNTSSD